MKVLGTSNSKQRGLSSNSGPPKRIRRMPPVQLANPRLFLSNNPRVKAQLAPYNPVNPKKIRAEIMDKLNQAVDKINRHIENSNIRKGVRFAVHEESNRFYATVIDKKTGEVIKTYPSESVLKIAGNLKIMSGYLINHQG